MGEASPPYQLSYKANVMMTFPCQRKKKETKADMSFVDF